MSKYFFLFICFPLLAWAQIPPAPYGPLPSARQLAWHEIELYGLVHFTPTTFEDKEWGYGDANPALFNPSNFDATQIVAAAKAGGLKGIVFVAKHHDGFCLWPTKTTSYNISQSPFRGGTGDMVKEMEQATRQQGLKFGIYCSPWDRNHPAYGTPEYLTIYREQLRELYTQYGDLFMSWHDGANGGDGYYGGANEKRSIDNTTYYEWNQTWNDFTRKLQPMANIFSDIGWDVRWIGNEKGIASNTHWSTFSPQSPDGKKQAVPGYSNYEESPVGHRNGIKWIPAECDVPLRQGWFYHSNETPKTPKELFSLYLQSVGRGAALDLGLAPNKVGQLAPEDVQSLTTFGTILTRTFERNLLVDAHLKASNIRGYNSRYSARNLTDKKTNTYWATDDDFTTPQIVMEFSHPQLFDLFEIKEHIALGQRIEGFAIDIEENEAWTQVYEGTSIGARRLVYFESPLTTHKVRIRITKCPTPVAISEMGLYKKSD